MTEIKNEKKAKTNPRRLDLTTHHCRNFSSNVVVDECQHKRRQEKEEGADSSVNQVLHEETKTQKITFDSRCI